MLFYFLNTLNLSIKKRQNNTKNKKFNVAFF